METAGCSLHECGAMLFMVQRGKMFGAVISYTGNSGSPIVTEFTLIILTTDPVEAHVHGFVALGKMVFFVTPEAVKLLFWRTELG